jgi:hypothetical protein
VLLCPGGSFSSPLSLTGSGPWEVTYSDGQTTTMLTGISTNPFVFSQTPSGSTTYTLSQVQDSYCQAAASGVIYAEVQPLPLALFSAPSPVCQGTPTPVSVTLAGTAPWSLDWSDGINQTSFTGISTSSFVFSITPDITATYGAVRIQDAYCFDTTYLPLSLTVQPLPIAYFTLAFTAWDSVQFTNSSQHFSTLQWDLGDQTISSQLNPLHGYAGSANSSVTIKLTVTNVCGSAEYDTTVFISGTASLPDLADFEISIFPNPVRDACWVECTNPNLQLEYLLYDLNGRALGNWQTLEAKTSHISLQSYSAGMYWIEFRNLEKPGLVKGIRIIKN